MGSLAERLKDAAGGGARMSNFDGQVLNVLSIEKEPSKFQKGATAVQATVLTPEGEEVTFYVTPTAANQLIEVEADLPLELRVESFPGQFGNTGYLFVESE